jgi:hypothetical protein
VIASLLLLSIGLADIARAIPSVVVRWLSVFAVWAATAVTGVAGLGVPIWAVVVIVLLSAAWAVAVSGNEKSRRGVWPALVLLLIVAAVTLADSTAATGFVVDAYENIRLDALADVDLRTALAGVAVAVFLTRSGNLIARAALGRSRDPEPTSTAPTREGWELRVRGVLFGTVTRPAQAAPDGPVLRGGRMIGPLERVLIVILALAGAPAIIAALLAAKGIVRFPEISADRASGSKAEEFLVGSLTSWSMSGAAVLYLAVLHSS